MNPFIVTSLNSDGSLFTVDTTNIESVVGSQGYSQNYAVATLSAIDSTDPYVSGARYREDGCLRLYDATAGLPSGVQYVGGVAFTSTGQMCITTDAVTNAIYISGMAVRQDGAVFAQPSSFYLPLADAGDGAVDLTSYGAGDTTFTFTRSTIATTIGSTGLIIPVSSGVARSYYDPTTLQYMGYLPEGARTNLFLRSEEFDNASWTKTDTTITANAAVAPDGNTTADLLTQGSAGTAAATQAVTATADATYSVTFFAKRGNSDWLFIGIEAGGNSVRGWFNLGTGAVGSTTTAGTGALSSIRIKAFANGFYRCELNASMGGGATSITVSTLLVTGDGLTSRVSGGTYYLWGAQFENNATFPSTYIPTAGSAVTRNADVLTFPFAGNADATAGTCYAELSTEWATADAFSAAVSFRASDGTLRVGAGEAATTITINDTVTSAQKTGLTSMATGSRKRASAWGSNKSATGDGATPAAAGFGGDMGSVSIAIGCLTGGTDQWFGTIRNVRIWNRQFTAAQLQAITTGP